MIGRRHSRVAGQLWFRHLRVQVPHASTSLHLFSLLARDHIFAEAVAAQAGRAVSISNVAGKARC